MAYVPTGMTSVSAGLPHLVATAYSERGLDRLQQTFRYQRACEPDMQERRKGRTRQWFRYNNLSGVTTTAAEGTVPTSGTISSGIVAGDVSQYSAYITASSFLTETALDPVVENMSDLLGYQAGLSVDQITRAAIDAHNANTVVSLFGTYPTAEDVRAGVARLNGRNVLPCEGSDYLLIVHPYTWFDIINDPAANGYADLFKFTKSDTSASMGYNVRARNIDHFNGVCVTASTGVTVTSGSPNTYRMYLFGKGGVLYSGISGVTPSEVQDPNTDKFKINVIPGGKATPYDWTGEIGGGVSYRFTYLTLVVSGSGTSIGGDYRYITWDCPTKLGL
jgi:N4-gp56 family major capsid protein